MKRSRTLGARKPRAGALERATEALPGCSDHTGFPPPLPGLKSNLLFPGVPRVPCHGLHPGLPSVVPSGLEPAPGARCRVSRQKLARVLQKDNFKPNWISRGSLALLIFPMFGLPTCIGGPELGKIEGIEKLGPELQLETLTDIEVLHEPKVPIMKRWSCQDISA